MTARFTTLARRTLLVGLALCAVLQWAAVRTKRITPAFTRIAAQAEGNFTEGSGWYPGEPFANASGVRAWGSWTGSDDNEGSLVVGPFRAPQMLRFGATGYPDHAGNSIVVELAEPADHTSPDTRRVIQTGDIGERWRIVEFELPRGWQGRPVRLVATDHAKGIGGWLGLSEPIRGGRSDARNGFIESLAAWAVNGLLLGALFFAALRLLAPQRFIPAPWLALAAIAVAALVGYIAFWAYFVNALVGVIFSWSAIAIAALIAVVPRRQVAAPAEAGESTDRYTEVRTVLQLTVAIGVFYLALLHLYPSPLDFHALAGNRFAEALPGDNVLSHVIGERLFAGTPPKSAGDEWQSSDRPPLQAGWQLLVWPAAKLLSIDRRVSSGTSAMWLQLAWVAAAYGLLRALGLERRRAAGWIATCASTGFFVQHTVFTWPKLSAGAFGCGAFAWWILEGSPAAAKPIAPADRARQIIFAGGFAVLAWLSHGGVAFSLLALLPWLLARAWRGNRRAWVLAGVTMAIIAAPWLAYQKLYDPPGDRLLKWHLGGHTEKDNVPTAAAIRDAYTKTPIHEIWSNKATNFHALVLGDWWRLFEFSNDTRNDRRYQEFFFTLRTLTWWPWLALLALALTRRSVWINDRGALVTVAAWSALTIVGWCLAFFKPYQAVVHQGTYALMIALFVGLSVALERSNRWWLLIVVVLAPITFWSNWGIGNNVIHGPATGWPLVALSALPLLAFVIGAARAGRGAEHCVPPSIVPAATPRWQQRLIAWWQNPRPTVWLLLALGLLMFLRKPHTLYTPQLWAEDGSVFLNDQDAFGLRAFTLPYMGYLHTLPRIVAWLAAHLLDPAWWPAFYNGVSFLIWLAVIARLFTRRFDLAAKPWLALAFVGVPHTGEVLFNVTNLQWITAFVLIQQVIIRPPQSRTEQVGDSIILAVVTLTGPFATIFLPLFAWRWWRERRSDTILPLLITAIAAAIQIVYVIRTGPKFPFQGATFHFGPAFEVVARRIVLWPIAGTETALALPGWSVKLVGGAVLAALAAWCLRPSPRRSVRAYVAAAFGLILIAGVYRTRPDTWVGDNLDFGDRYFYIPRVLLAWLLIWEFDAVPICVANAARLFCLGTVFMHSSHYVLPAPPDYHWRDNVEPIRRGAPANIPILPEGWTLEYRGRAK